MLAPGPGTLAGMSVLAAQVTIPYESAIPADVTTNTWHFQASEPDPTAAELQALAGRLEEFYGAAAAPSVVSVASFLSSELVLANARLKVYDLGTPQPRAPIYDEAFYVATGPSSSALPTEVAVCLSFQGLRVSGLPQARRRGRVYIGPLGNTVQASGTVARPSGPFRDAMANAAQRLQGYNETPILPSDANLKWVVWSPTALSAVDVTDGWVDDAFDIQRRRGEAPTVRRLWPVP